MRKFRSIEVRVPATTANLGPGFDCLGMALRLYNTFRVRPAVGAESTMHGTGTCEGITGTDNPFFEAIEQVLALKGESVPAIDVEVEGGVPVARGLGSSATAIVGGVLVANAMLGEPFERDQLLNEMNKAEGHPDNVTPAYLGGLSASVELGGIVRAIRNDPHSKWYMAMLVPGYQLSTAKARGAIPAQIPHGEAVFNVTRVPFVLHALTQGITDGLGEAMEDKLHEPYRKKLIKGYGRIRKAATDAGASGVYLSGAGPTMGAVCRSKVTGERVIAAMTESVGDMKFGTTPLLLKPDRQGARIKIR